MAATLLAYTALAAVPTATPVIVNTNTTTINRVQIASASVARASDQLFGSSNFSSDILTCVRSLPSLWSASNASLEENSTFKWIKRTLYLPQNRSLVGYWKLDGNANDSSAYRNGGVVV